MIQKLSYYITHILAFFAHKCNISSPCFLKDMLLNSKFFREFFSELYLVYHLIGNLFSMFHTSCG